MGFKGWLAKGWEITKLDRDAAELVAHDPESFWPAVLFFAIGGLAEGIGASVLSAGSSIVFAPVLTVLASFIGVGILHLVALMLGGKSDFKSYYSALGIGSLPLWARIVPGLGHIVALWEIPVSVVVTERVHGLSTGRAVVVALFPLVLFLLVIGLIIALFGVAMMAAVLGYLGMASMVGAPR
jgi:hypothetical protein